MKSLFLLFIIFSSPLVWSFPCQVFSQYTHLAHKLNKQTICTETYRSLEEHYGELKNISVEIEAFGFIEMYEVELTVIRIFKNETLIFKGSGLLKWWPGHSEVILD